MQATKLFYCYAHNRKDKLLRDQLTTQLAALKREGLIAEWCDQDIGAGKEWQKEIDEHLNAADIILLLISPDFIHSDYCYSREMLKALERHHTGNTRVIPIILRPVDWEKMPFGKLQALPTEGKPITSWRNRDEAFLDVAKGVKKVIEEFLPVSDVCPYLGLRAFTEQDHELFFGRERAVETLLKRLKNSPDFLALLGPSGSGKSSLVQAGVMRQLRLGTWLGTGERLEAIISRPSSDPFAELTLRGLPSTSTNLTERVQVWRDQHLEKERLVLIIDQFEEVWTLCSPKMAQDFTSQLVALINASECDGYITLILVMRDDFYPHLGRHEALAELVDASRVRVPPTLRRTELATIVQEPAKAQRLRFAEGLVDTIIEDILTASSTEVEGELVTDNTILPLLEFALTRLWEQRQDREMTREAYNRIGRVSGGLTVWADEAFRRLDKRLQPLARAIFTKLVHLGNENQNILHSRRRRTLTSLYPEQKDTHFVIARLAEARLLVTSRDPRDGEESVEIIHDVLLREWNLLHRWITEDRVFLSWRQEFEKRLQLWIETDPNDPLLRDEGRLLRGRDLDDAEHWMAERALDFDSVQQDFITMSRKQAEQQHQTTIARQLVAQAEFIRTQQPEFVYRSVALAAEAMRRIPSLEADQALRSAIASIPDPLTRLTHQDAVKSVAFSPDGRYLATASVDCTARVWEMPISLKHGSGVKSVTFSPDGHYLVTSGEQSTAGVWEMPQAVPIEAPTHQGPVNALAFSPDGQYLATASSDHTVRVWEAISWRQVTSFTHQGPVNTLAFSPDGQYLATASEDRTAGIWEITSRQRLAHLNHKDNVNALAFSPNGRYLATASSDGTAGVWEVPSGQQLTQLLYGFQVCSVAFSPDGQYLATAGWNVNAIVWVVPSDQQLVSLKHGSGVESVVFNPDGHYLVTPSEQSTARVWEMPISLKHGSGVKSVTFSPDGHRLVTSGGQSTARVWEMPSGRLLLDLPHVGGETQAVAFSSDGRYLATTGNVIVRVCEVASGRQIACLFTEGHDLHTVVFSPDGRYLVTAGKHRTVEIWEITDKPQLAHLVCKGIKAMAFSPNGRNLVTASGTGIAAIWELASGQQLTHFTFRTTEFGDITLSSDGRYLATKLQGLWEVISGRHVADFLLDTFSFSPDGSRLAIAADNVEVLDVGTGQFLFHLQYPDTVKVITFSPNGRYLAAASEGPYPSSIWNPAKNLPVVVWEMTSGNLLASFAHTSFAEQIIFSPDGQYLATVSIDGAVVVWETAIGSRLIDIPCEHSAYDIAFSPDGRYLAIAVKHYVQVCDVPNKRLLPRDEHRSVRRLTFSPNGRYLASAGGDNAACIWELATSHRLARLCHEDWVTGIAFSPDSHYIATSSWDHTVGIWESTTGTRLSRLSHDDKVEDVSFSPDGRYLVTMDWNDTLQVWLWRPEDLIAKACDHLPRNLTEDEWQMYLGNEPYRKLCPDLM